MKRKIVFLITIALLISPITYAQSEPQKQTWEYNLLSSIDLTQELMRQLQAEKVYNFDITTNSYTIDGGGAVVLQQHMCSFLTKRFNELGKKGWIFSGCTGEKNDTFVFRRPK